MISANLISSKFGSEYWIKNQGFAAAWNACAIFKVADK